MAVLAPMPSARESTETMVKVGFRRSCRSANRRSLMRDSIAHNTHWRRLWLVTHFRQRNGERTDLFRRKVSNQHLKFSGLRGDRKVAVAVIWIAPQHRLIGF